MEGERIYTIGHSNRPIEEFIAFLKAQRIGRLCDIRTVPKSAHNPQFADDALPAALREAGIQYVRLAALGGFRKTRADSKNLGWKNLSFRGYADYMETAAFAVGLDELGAYARERRTAIMCAEAVPWRCHRSLVADALLVRGWQVLDIIGSGEPKPHRLTPFAKVKKGELSYPGATAPLL